ncbi:hypothetical protein GQ457_10G015890 [Hibiscus cannabinus]
MERLSHAIYTKVHSGIWRHLHLSRYGPGISHLFFADDLILFAEASLDQLTIIQQTLNEFCACSGHRISVSKSQIHFSDNVCTDLREEIVQGFGYEVVEELGIYLGVPLLHKRVTRAIYGYLIDKVHQRLSGWTASSLSLSGRITLANSVLQAIPSYAMQSAYLPKAICDELEKLIRNFIWGSSSDKRKIHLVNWGIVQQPIGNGGLGLKDLGRQNKAFLMKLAFQLVTNVDKLWIRVIKAKYKWGDQVPLSLKLGNCLRLWRGFGAIWDVIRDSIMWNVRNGAIVNFWNDVWLDSVGPLSSHFIGCRVPDNSCVADWVSASGSWDWDRLRHVVPVNVLQHIFACPAPNSLSSDDVPCWRWTAKRAFTTNSAYVALGDSSNPNSSVWRVLWKVSVPQRVRTFLWLTVHGKLLTNQERVRRSLTIVDAYFLCNNGSEDVLHVLRDCIRARTVWRQVIQESK